MMMSLLELKLLFHNTAGEDGLDKFTITLTQLIALGDLIEFPYIGFLFFLFI